METLRTLKGYVVAGNLHGVPHYLSELPNHVGNYGMAGKEWALIFPTEKKARWHAARAFCFDGHRGWIVPVCEGEVYGSARA